MKQFSFAINFSLFNDQAVFSLNSLPQKFCEKPTEVRVCRGKFMGNRKYRRVRKVKSETPEMSHFHYNFFMKYEPGRVESCHRDSPTKSRGVLLLIKVWSLDHQFLNQTFHFLLAKSIRLDKKKSERRHRMTLRKESNPSTLSFESCDCMLIF